jgi:hypothetical protein
MAVKDINEFEKNMMNAARDYSHKFDFYFVALIFSILSLAIQTSQPISSTENIQRFFEVSAWACLLISGLSGLFRMDLVPRVMINEASISSKEKVLGVINEKLNTPNDDDEYMDNSDTEEVQTLIESGKTIEKIVGNLKGERSITHKKINYGEKINRWAFVIGMILLVTSRMILIFTKVSSK